MIHSDDLQVLSGGVLVGGFDGTSLPAVVRARLADGRLGGVTLFKRNVESTAQVMALCAALADAGPADRPTLISIDQEGGRVARLGPPVTALPPMRDLGRGDPEATRRRAARLGAELAALGINLDFAPVCDVDSNPLNPVIGDRAFGSDPDTVARHAVAFVRGLQDDAGVLACAKHFPGHGDTETDSHLELPRVRHDRARLDAVELPPFAAAVRAGVATVMSAHVVYDGLAAGAPGVPATLSRAVMVDLLRGVLGFTGVAFSDDLHMKALSARMSVEDAAVAAIEAGCDGLLVCTDTDSQERAREALAARADRDGVFARRLREAHGRMLALRRRAPPRPLRDPAALEDFFRGSSAG